MQPGQGTYIPSQEELNTDFPPRNQEKLQIRSSVMLVSSYWHGKYHANKVNELMEASFSQDEMFEDMSRVSTLLNLSKVQKNRTTTRRTGGAGQAQALYQLLEDMDSADITPDFVVGADQMEEIQRALTNSSLATGENVQVGARLESVEQAVKDMSEKIGALCTAPIISGTAMAAPAVFVTEADKNTFANVVKKNAGVKPKSRSNSQKRSAEDEVDGFNPVKKKNLKEKLGKAVIKLWRLINMRYSLVMWQGRLPRTR